MEIVPKIEKEIPSTLDLSEKILPKITEWEVGKRYMVKLEIENVSKNQGSMYDPNDKSEIRSSFRVLGAQSLEMGEMPEKEDKKGAFMRAISNLVKQHMGE